MDNGSNPISQSIACRVMNVGDWVLMARGDELKVLFRRPDGVNVLVDRFSARDATTPALAVRPELSKEVRDGADVSTSDAGSVVSFAPAGDDANSAPCGFVVFDVASGTSKRFASFRLQVDAGRAFPNVAAAVEMVVLREGASTWDPVPGSRAEIAADPRRATYVMPWVPTRDVRTFAVRVASGSATVGRVVVDMTSESTTT